MLAQMLVPSGATLQLISATLTSEHVHVELSTTATAVPCSSCQVKASRVHSYYQRTLADLPLTQLPLRLKLHVRRFYCDNPTCAHRTFSEAVPELVSPFARRTDRLAAEQRQLGLDVGGEVGARTAKRQGMPVSPDTILRLVRRHQYAQQPPRSTPTPTKLGVDDFAWRKGQRYGTILVDLDQHQAVDLLPDRSAATFEQWLREHPGVQLIARDRASDYADGAARGAPDAVQVADRFHLLQNVREMLQRLLERHQAALRAASKPPEETPEGVVVRVTEFPAAEVEDNSDDASASTTSDMGCGVTVPYLALALVAQQSQRSEQSRAARLERYHKVRELHAQGHSNRSIAGQLQLGRHTVRRFVVADRFPERATCRKKPSKLDPFVSYLERQLAAGQDNGMELWRNIRDKYGYSGSRALVSGWVARHRYLCPTANVPNVPNVPTPEQRRRGRPAAPPTKPRHSPPRPRRLSARQAAFLMMRPSEGLEETDQSLLERLCKESSEVQIAHRLAHEFMGMVRNLQGDGLDCWLRRAEESGIAEMRSFVAGIRRDHAAVLAGLTLPYSSGQVEGQVNRLKFIKRSGYGRAKFDLLRHRVLVT